MKYLIKALDYNTIMYTMECTDVTVGVALSFTQFMYSN